MKLHEEFKEYEQLWEAKTPAVTTFIRTLGTKSYNLDNPTELKAFIDDSLAAAVKKAPKKYANDSYYRDKYQTMCYYVFEDLINSFKNSINTEIHRDFINKLYKLRDKYLDDIHDTNDQDRKTAKAEIAKLAEQCVKSFINDLHKIGTYKDYSGNNIDVNIESSYMLETIEDATDALSTLGKALLANYWTY